jgi:hypothetical protein
MAHKVPNIQIGRPRLLLTIVWLLLPISCRSDSWGDFHETYTTPGRLMRRTFKAIQGAIRSQTEERYYPGRALMQMLAIPASLLGILTPFGAVVVAGSVTAGLFVRDLYTNPKNKGYACFLWDAVIATCLLIVFQALVFLGSSGHLISVAPRIAAQSVVGAASAAFFRLIFRMPQNPFDRVLEDYKDVLTLNLIWIVACEVLMYTSVVAVSYRPLNLLSGAPLAVGAALIRLESPGLGGVLAPRLMSLTTNLVRQTADRAKGRLALPAQTPAQFCLELGYFAVLLLPFGAALWKWWTKQDVDVDWTQVRANAFSLLILSAFWLRIRELNDETVKAFDQKVKDELKRLDKPPEETDDGI